MEFMNSNVSRIFAFLAIIAVLGTLSSCNHRSYLLKKQQQDYRQQYCSIDIDKDVLMNSFETCMEKEGTGMSYCSQNAEALATTQTCRHTTAEK